MIHLDTEKLARWETMSDEERLPVLMQELKSYNKVDNTYDNYILLTLAAHGFLRIEYDKESVTSSVLRHATKENISILEEKDKVWAEKFTNSISIVHTVPMRHSLYPLVKFTQSHFANNYTHSHNLYDAKFEADFTLSYLLLLMGEKVLLKKLRAIILAMYTPQRNTTLFGVTSSSIKDYEWESFVIDLLDIKKGSVLDALAGIGTLSMLLDLNNIEYTAHLPKQNERDLASMLFSSPRLSKSYKQGKIQVFRTFPSIKGNTYDFVIASLHTSFTSCLKLSFKEVLDLMTTNGKALVICDKITFRNIKFDQYLHLVESVILCRTDLAWSIIVVLNKNKELTDSVKVYDRTHWKKFTIEQLQESIHKQENVRSVSRLDIEEMGGEFNIDIFKRKQQKHNIPNGHHLVKLNDFIKYVNPKEKAVRDIKLLPEKIEGYSPLAPYISASQGIVSNKEDKDTYYVVDQKTLIVVCGAEQTSYRPLIFDHKEGEIGIDIYCKCFIVNEEKVNIDYLVYQMNEEYFVKQLYPHEEENCNSIKAKDILSCKILVPDVNDSIERQKQSIEEKRQRVIAEFAKRHGFDLGKFVQYKNSDLPNGTKLCRGKYTILQTISSGGFGKVYKARNEESGEVVAIKEFFYHDMQVRDPETLAVLNRFSDFDRFNQAKDKFLFEKEKIQIFQHDNIIKVYDSFEEKNTCYYTMEYIEGKNLYEYRKKPIGEKEALGIIQQIAEALKVMHAKGCNHSDVKPQNILIDYDGKATLIDFGSAHRYGNSNEEGTSKSQRTALFRGESVGYTPKLAYQSSEFHAHRDIYSLGATLFFLLTGKSPEEFHSNSKPETISPKMWTAICKAMEERVKKWINSVDIFLQYLPNENELNDDEKQQTQEELRVTPKFITALQEDEVFVFGSNLEGLHYGGAAKQALKWGAKWGVGVGEKGQTYAIPTVKVDLNVTKQYIDQFISYVKANDHLTFYVTAIGCGNAGYTPEEMAPLFKECMELSSVYLPEAYWKVLKKQQNLKLRIQRYEERVKALEQEKPKGVLSIFHNKNNR